MRDRIAVASLIIIISSIITIIVIDAIQDQQRQEAAANEWRHHRYSTEQNIVSKDGVEFVETTAWYQYDRGMYKKIYNTTVKIKNTDSTEQYMSREANIANTFIAKHKYLFSNTRKEERGK